MNVTFNFRTFKKKKKKMTETFHTRYRSLIDENIKETKEAVRWSIGIKQKSEI